jgi:hypothetical protein
LRSVRVDDPTSGPSRQDSILSLGWFTLIAVCTLLNSLLLQTGRFVEFYAGLYVTQVIDAMGQGLSSVEPEGVSEPSFFPLMALLVDLLIVGALVLLGLLAFRKRRWASHVGIVWYGIDTLLFLLAGQWLAGVVHGFGLYWASPVLVDTI